jgi:hypothetical protein
MEEQGVEPFFCPKGCQTLINLTQLELELQHKFVSFPKKDKLLGFRKFEFFSDSSLALGVYAQSDPSYVWQHSSQIWLNLIFNKKWRAKAAAN